MQVLCSILTAKDLPTTAVCVHVPVSCVDNICRQRRAQLAEKKLTEMLQEGFLNEHFPMFYMVLSSAATANRLIKWSGFYALLPWQHSDIVFQ